MKVVGYEKLVRKRNGLVVEYLDVQRGKSDALESRLYNGTERLMKSYVSMHS